VLEQRNLATGVVSAITGQTRARITFTGQAGHAGTVPMNLRRDALAAGAEFILAVESLAQSRGGLVATVGEIQAVPGAGNVIPGEAQLTLDVRHPNDTVRQNACEELKRRASETASKRNVESNFETVHETTAVICDRGLTVKLEQAVKRHQAEVPLLTSGAGHDAAAVSAICPVTMLFVRCKGGISHNPDESVETSDVRVAIEVLADFIQTLAKENS
jgi:allantoate deiminase